MEKYGFFVCVYVNIYEARVERRILCTLVYPKASLVIMVISILQCMTDLLSEGGDGVYCPAEKGSITYPVYILSL
jgi:hypothetical protein